jgi:hypothetical protein
MDSYVRMFDDKYIAEGYNAAIDHAGVF